MKALPSDFITKCASVFTSPIGLTLMDVRGQVSQEPPTTRRRDRLSALDAIPRLFKTSLERIEATNAGLANLFRGHSGPNLGVSRKTLQNIRSQLYGAVEAYGIPAPSLMNRIPLSPIWATLLYRIADRDYASSLRRLGCFCSAMGIEPVQVGQETLLGFYEALKAEAKVKNPKVTLRLATTYWNMQLKLVPEWPKIRLSSPFASNRYKQAFEDLPTPLQHQIREWENARLGADALSLKKHIRNSRPNTIAHQTETLLRYIALLTNNGLASLNERSSLETLLDPPLVQGALRILMKERRRKAAYVHQYAYVLLSIARHHTKLPSERVAELATLSAI